MAGTSLALSLTGALGLILLGAWMSTEGMRYVSGGAWGQLLSSARWRPFAALRAGMASSILVPSTHTLMRGSIVAGSSGSLGVQPAMLLGMGVSFAAVAGAGWAALFALTGAGHLPGFVLLCLAALASRMPSELRPIGAREILGGLGLAVLGMSELAEVTATLGEFARLDAWNISMGLRVAACVVMGAMVAWGLQTPSGAVAVGVLFGAGGLLSVPSSAAFVLGAFAGGGLANLGKLRSPEADDRRVALGLGIYHLACVAIGLLFLPWLMPLTNSWDPALNMAAPALLLSFAVLVGLVLMSILSGPVSRLLDRMFVEVEEGVGRSVQVDPSLGVFPDLLVAGARQRLARQTLLTRVLSRSAFGGEQVTDRRLASDLGLIRQWNDGLTGLVLHTQRMRMNDEVASELPEIGRASTAIRTIADCAAELRNLKAAAGSDAASSDPLAQRMRQLELMYRNAVEGCGVSNQEQPAVPLREELETVQEHTRALCASILEACERQHVAVERVSGYLQRLNCLERLGVAALDASQSLEASRMESLVEGLGASPTTEAAMREASAPVAPLPHDSAEPASAPRVPTADLHGWAEEVVAPRKMTDTVVMRRPQFGGAGDSETNGTAPRS